MRMFEWLGDIIKPVTNLIDELHTSDEEQGNIDIKLAELKNKVAEMEFKVATKVIDFQGQLNENNTKLAVAEQEHGNMYTKAVRPTIMAGCFIMLSLMGFDIIPFNQYLAVIYGSFLGVYTGARTYEKKK